MIYKGQDSGATARHSPPGILAQETKKPLTSIKIYKNQCHFVKRNDHLWNSLRTVEHICKSMWIGANLCTSNLNQITGKSMNLYVKPMRIIQNRWITMKLNKNFRTTVLIDRTYISPNKSTKTKINSANKSKTNQKRSAAEAKPEKKMPFTVTNLPILGSHIHNRNK